VLNRQFSVPANHLTEAAEHQFGPATPPQVRRLRSNRQQVCPGHPDAAALSVATRASR